MGDLYKRWKKLNSPMLECEAFRLQDEKEEQEERDYEEYLIEQEHSFRLSLLEKEQAFEASENAKKLEALNNFSKSIILMAQAIIVASTNKEKSKDN